MSLRTTVDVSSPSCFSTWRGSITAAPFSNEPTCSFEIPAFAIDATLRSASLTSVASKLKIVSVASRSILAVVWSMPVHMFLKRLTRLSPGCVVASPPSNPHFSRAKSVSSSFPGASMPAIGRGKLMSYGCSTDGLVCTQKAFFRRQTSGILKVPSAPKYDAGLSWSWFTRSGVESKSTRAAPSAFGSLPQKTFSGPSHESPPNRFTPCETMER